MGSQKRGRIEKFENERAMSMKKRILLLLLASCLAFSGCTGHDSESTDPYSPDKRVQNMYNSPLNSVFHFIETADTFYGLNAGRIYYYDRQSGISDFLCPDPSCTHADDSCGAYTASEMSSLFSLYGGKIYWLGLEAPTDYRSLCLWRCDPDGTDHEKYKVLDHEKYAVDYIVGQWTLYGDKLFFEARCEVVLGEQAAYHVRFGYLPLDGDEEVLLLDEVKAEPCGNPYIFYLNGKVFYGLTTGSSELKIFCFDLEKETTELLLHTDDFAEARRDGYRMWVTEDETVYIASDLALYRVQNGTLVERYALSDTTQSIMCLGDGVVVWSSVADGYRMVEIRDFEGTLLYSGKLFPEPVEGFDEMLGMWTGIGQTGFFFMVLGGDSEKIIVNMQNQKTANGNSLGDENNVFLLDIQNNMKATHLWTIGTVTMYEPD